MSYIISTKPSKFSNFREMKKWGNCVQFYHLCVYYSLSHVKFFVTPRTVAIQAPLPWHSPGKDTRVGCHSLLGILQTQGWNLVLLHCRRILYNLSHEEALYHLVRAKKLTWSNQEIYATLNQFSWVGFVTPSTDINYGLGLKSPSNEQ